jgi:hypothetical protein
VTALVWLFGGVVAGVLVAGAVAWWQRPTLFQAAIEADRRCGLKERLSSALSLEPREQLHGAGAALVHDAARRAERASVVEQFPLRPQPRGLLPLLPLALLPLALLLPERSTMTAASPVANSAEESVVKESAKQLQEQLRVARKRAEAQGLEEAQVMLKKMEGELEELQKRSGIDRKQAMVKLNDFKQQLQQRRDQLGDSDQLKRRLGSLQKMETGPIEEAAKALEKGDLAAAEKAIRELADKLRDGKLDEEQQKQLASQARQIAEKLNELKQQRAAQQRQLQEQLTQALRDGRADDAAKVQRQLDQLASSAKQDQQLESLAESMQQAAKASAQSDSQAGAKALDAMAKQLGQMQREASERASLEDAMEGLSECKEGMCQGEGNKPGAGGKGKGSGAGDFAKGEGRGAGKRDEEETETNRYDSQVRDKPRDGPTVFSGFADGPNRKGSTREEVKLSIQEMAVQQGDPVESQALPQAERDQAQQYFDQFRSE